MGHADMLRRRARRLAHTLAIRTERMWDSTRASRRAGRTPKDFRIDAYGGHGSTSDVVIRGRALDNREPGAAIDGEGTWRAVRRTLERFLSNELPGVPLEVTLGASSEYVVTDADGYFEARLHNDDSAFVGPWSASQIRLADVYRGMSPGPSTAVDVRVSGSEAGFGVISDIDDTILHTGAQRALDMVRQTFTGSELTRVPFAGAAELYRALADSDGGEANPFFYVSSSPWNLHSFLSAFLRHRRFPIGPLLLRDLLGNSVEHSHASHKHSRIAEVLELHPQLRFVLIGDSGQYDPTIYADVVRRHPGRIIAIYIREVRLDPGDRRVEEVSEAWDEAVPFVLAADSAAVAAHASGLGLIDAAAVGRVAEATARTQN